MNRGRTALVVIGLFVLHVSVFAHLRPFDVAPDLMLLAAVVGAMAGGVDFGARHGFVCGLLVDLMSSGPFGLAAGVYGAVGHGAGSLAQTLDSQDPRVGPLATALGSAIGTAGYGLGLGVLGAEQYVEWRLVWVAGLVAVYNVLLSLPVQRAYNWAISSDLTYARPTKPRSVVN